MPVGYLEMVLKGLARAPCEVSVEKKEYPSHSSSSLQIQRGRRRQGILLQGDRA